MNARTGGSYRPSLGRHPWTVLDRVASRLTPWPSRRSAGSRRSTASSLRGAADPNPVLASSMLINGYVEHHKVGWDFEDESPGRDARGFAREGAMPPEIETHLVNTVLTNGARYYVDHAHPEYSTPECSDALELVCADKAGERILARSMLAARRLLGAGPGDRRLQEQLRRQGQLLRHARELPRRPRGAVRRRWCATCCRGSSAARCSPAPARSAPRTAPRAVDYQISQRADFFEEEVGLETTLKRPIVNTRDEPHADPQTYRRLHVIAGDANLCEVATFLKVGTTAIVLAMVEDGFIEKDLSIIGPVHAMRTVSHDPTCRATVELLDGGRITAVELQWEFLRLAQKYADETGLDACGGDDVGGMVLDALGVGAHRPRARPDAARRPARLGHQARAAPGLHRPRRPRVVRPQAVAARPAVPRRPPRPLALREAGAGGQGRAPGRRSRRAGRDHGGPRDAPGPTSAAAAWPGGPTRSSRPTGTA